MAHFEMGELKAVSAAEPPKGEVKKPRGRMETDLVILENAITTYQETIKILEALRSLSKDYPIQDQKVLEGKRDLPQDLREKILQLAEDDIQLPLNRSGNVEAVRYHFESIFLKGSYDEEITRYTEYLEQAEQDRRSLMEAIQKRAAAREVAAAALAEIEKVTSNTPRPRTGNDSPTVAVIRPGEATNEESEREESLAV